MKQFFKISVIALSMLMLGAMLSSCGDITPKDTTVAYIAEGSVSGGLLGSAAVAYFQEAINKAVGTGYVEPNDSKVIAACDNVHNSLKEDKSLEGSVQILKKGKDGSGKAIKTYTYKKSK